jgi:hypothetical protein
METETEFKFEPIWVTVLSLVTFFIIYTCVGTFIKSSSTDIGDRTTGSIVINLKNPEKYYNTPLKAMWYKLSQLFTSNDINLRLDFVAGKNDTIFQLVNAYWDKHSGS